MWERTNGGVPPLEGPIHRSPWSTGLSTCPSVRVSCPSVRVSWTSLSSVRLALGLPQGKLGVTLAYVADTSHSKLVPPMHEHAPRLTRRRARRRSRAYVVARSGIRAHTSSRAQEFGRIRRLALRNLRVYVVARFGSRALKRSGTHVVARSGGPAHM